MPYIETAIKLIVIDAMETGDKPGAVYRLHLDDLKTRAIRASAHDINLLSLLDMMKLTGKRLPEIIVIGIQPKEIAWGTELSPEVEEKIPEIIRLILEEIGNKHTEREPAIPGSIR
jgi:hydrogenase maturation protease